MSKGSKIDFTELRKFKHLFTQKKIPRKTVLLPQGKVTKAVYYIEKGCIRQYHNSDGKDITFQFFFENQFIMSIVSFKTNEPSLFSLETLEPSILYTISKNDFQNKILDQSPVLTKRMDEIIFRRFIIYQKLFLSRIKDSPEKRYKDLIEKNPEILKRIPQHYIASFLGITSVSLSRIKNRL